MKSIFIQIIFSKYTTTRKLLPLFLLVIPLTVFSENTIKGKLLIDKDTFLLNSEMVIRVPDHATAIRFKLDMPLENQALWRYKLDGLTNYWSPWGNVDELMFHLIEGNYVLHLEDTQGNLSSYPFYIERKHSWIWTSYLLVALVALYFIYYFLIRLVKSKLIVRIRKEIKEEMTKEPLPKSIPVPVAVSQTVPKEISEVHQTNSQKYDQVSVLFADIQGFTKIVEHLNPELLIDELDKFFFHFDEVVEKYDIEKIKTIGDAYMCAGGLPIKNRTNPIEVVLAAIEMQQFMKSIKHNNDETNPGIWELRIGIHTGPVISGMIGRKKIAFDIWGDTVNIASRMESSGIAGEVNITGITYQYIRDFFNCQYRGKMPIKYKGETDMYFVKGIKPELSLDEKGLVPNESFFIRLQHIRYGDLEEYIISRFRQELPNHMYYHNVEHTIDVITRIEIIGRGEEVSERDLLILKTAALLHDTGFLVSYINHEQNSIAIAKEILPKFKYSDHQIEEIIRLIEVTHIDTNPETLLEQIINDADLDYLGRPDFIFLSENLFHEINHHDERLTIEEWNHKQYAFILNHQYYTTTARKLRQVNKVRQLDKLKALTIM